MKEKKRQPIDSRTHERRPIDAIPLDQCVATKHERTNACYAGGVAFEVHPRGEAEAVASDYPYPFEDCDSRLEKAWNVLHATPHEPWKTVGMLNTLRQAFREFQAQGMPIRLPLSGTKGDIDFFLMAARDYDALHHGRATF